MYVQIYVVCCATQDCEVLSLDTLYSNMKSFLQHPFPERMKVLTLGRSGGAFRAVVQAQAVAVAALPPVLGTRAGPGVSVAQVPPET